MFILTNHSTQSLVYLASQSAARLAATYVVLNVMSIGLLFVLFKIETPEQALEEYEYYKYGRDCLWAFVVPNVVVLMLHETIVTIWHVTKRRHMNMVIAIGFGLLFGTAAGFVVLSMEGLGYMGIILLIIPWPFAGFISMTYVTRSCLEEFELEARPIEVS